LYNNNNIYEPFLPSFCKAYQEKDEELILKILNEVWWKAPDDQSIHSLPSGMLSVIYVLNLGCLIKLINKLELF
jgi:hypothetical protein